MKLVLFRHGLAMDRSQFQVQKKDDALRPLVTKGREKTLSMAKRLKNWERDFDLIVSSPYLRALQTARILAQTLKISNLFECAELTPSAPPLAFAQWLRIHAEESLSVLVVGHEPHLSGFASWCLAGQQQSFMELKKSGMVCLEVESFSHLAPGVGQLQWLVSPKLFE
jgi:phosphohistidine phosphatase